MLMSVPRRRKPFSNFAIVLGGVALIAACVFGGRCILAQSAVPSTASSTVSRTTKSRLDDPGWWPTKSGFPRNEYVGPAACATCHSSEAKSAQQTAMAHAATRAANAESLRKLPLAFEIGPYKYQITESDGKKIQKISKGGASHSDVLLWAFGMGRMAQTYVYEEKGDFFEGHLSFYTKLQALDITPGHSHSVPSNLVEGAGRQISSEEKRRCFECHTTASTTNKGFDSETLIPGVTCEACHGPGAAHVAAMKSGDFDLGTQSIVKPAKLNPVDSVEFCGACHRTWQDVVSDGPTRIGTLNIRFAPYRLQNSRCWKEGKGDARITCITCHDPHQPLVEDPAAYDPKCLQCHLAAGAPKSDDHRTACTIGVKLCVTCHMPKYKSQGFHFTFTDHWIRSAEPGTPLPD
jgi:Cytochrome c554 and c-prime